MKLDKESLMRGVRDYIGGISSLEQLLGDDGQSIIGENGQAVRVRKWYSPPSLAGLCLELGISSGQWESLRGKGELGEVFDYVNTVLRAYYEQELTTRKSSVSGILRQLERCEGQGSSSGDFCELTLDERVEILRELGVDVGEE